MGPMMQVSDEVRVNRMFHLEDFVLMFEGGGRDLSMPQHQAMFRRNPGHEMDLWLVPRVDPMSTIKSYLMTLPVMLREGGAIGEPFRCQFRQSLRFLGISVHVPQQSVVSQKHGKR